MIVGVVVGPIAGAALGDAAKAEEKAALRGEAAAERAAMRGEEKAALKGETEVVERAMSRAELKATRDSGLVRGGRSGPHYVSDHVNHDPMRARQRLALPQTPEVRVRMEVPKGAFSDPTKAAPRYRMPGGGMQRIGYGQIPARIIGVWEY